MYASGMGGPVHLPSPSLIITTDASKKGDGGELKAALFTLKSFAKVYQMTNAHMRFKIDNTSAQVYINHQGGGGGGQNLWVCAVKLRSFGSDVCFIRQ